MVFLHAYVCEVLNSMICYTPVCMSRGDKSEYIFFYTVQCMAHSWNSVAFGFHNSMNILNKICLSGGGGRARNPQDMILF